MKKLYRIVLLTIVFLASTSLWAQKEDIEVIPIEIKMERCKLLDADTFIEEYVTIIMKLRYYTITPELTFLWDIEVYKQDYKGTLMFEDSFMGPRAVINTNEKFFLSAGGQNYSLAIDLKAPQFFHIFELGKTGPKKHFFIESDNSSWIDYFINWAYFTGCARFALFSKGKQIDDEAKSEMDKYSQIVTDLIENYPNGFSLQRDKKLPTLKQLEKRMKANFSISNYFDPVTDEELSGKASTPSKPTNNTLENNLSKGAWRTSMRKVVDNVTEKFSNGAYKGQKTNDKREGWGVYWWNDGSYYVGEWSNGTMNGYGLFICAEVRTMNNCLDCVYYVGNWKDGKKSGKGTCYDKYGNLIYSGDFSNDRPTGTYPTKGNYSSYKFECIKYESNNSAYIGETKDGKRHGYGIFIWNNWYGNAWYGHWDNDNRSGYGIDLFYDGTIKYGRWNGDEYYNTSNKPTNNTNTSSITSTAIDAHVSFSCAGGERGYTLSHANKQVGLQKGVCGDGELFIIEDIGKGRYALACLGKEKGYYLSHANGRVFLQKGIRGEGEHWIINRLHNGFSFRAVSGEEGLFLSHANGKVRLQKNYQGEGELWY